MTIDDLIDQWGFIKDFQYTEHKTEIFFIQQQGDQLLQMF